MASADEQPFSGLVPTSLRVRRDMSTSTTGKPTTNTLASYRALPKNKMISSSSPSLSAGVTGENSIISSSSASMGQSNAYDQFMKEMKGLGAL